MNIPEIITATAGLVTAIGGVILLLRKVKQLDQKTEHVRELVNSNHQAMLRREGVLISALQQAGVAIPPDESLGMRQDKEGQQ